MSLPLSVVVNVTVQVYKSLFVSDDPPASQVVHLHHVAPALRRPADVTWEVDDIVLQAA
jgi:hypothetical protein